VTVPTIPGWIEQWYGKVPADEKVILKLPPGAITGELQAPPFAVDVCEIESLLVHVTVPPTGTIIGLGLKAVVVIAAAFATIDAATPEPEGDVVDEGVDGEEEPHANEEPSNAATSAIRKVK
jgi:hypothetical protein